MSRTRLILQSLRYHWRTQLAVLFGMTIGTAVLCGALVVGDSVRGSLRDITLERLGDIDYALSTPNFFGEGLADRLAETEGFADSFDAAAPAILTQASIEAADSGAFARDINLVGADQRFWNLQIDHDAVERPGFVDTASGGDAEEGVWLNATLAEELGVAPGDVVLLRFRKPDPIPAEAVHGRRTGATVTLRLSVGGILPNRGFGRFGLRPTQQLPKNAFLPLEDLQKRIDQPGQVNSLFVSDAGEAVGQESSKFSDLQKAVIRAATLDDLGLRLVVHEEENILSLESLRMVLRQTDSAAATQAAEAIGAPVTPVLTYLANTIEVGGRSLPYSTVSALDPTVEPPLGPLRLIDGEPAPTLESGEIYLNGWAAEELDIRPSDSVELTYYLSGPSGEFRDDGQATFRFKGVVAMEGLGADPSLTPTYPGISDARSMRDWDPPFPIDLSRIRETDENYWEEYQALPKAFISLEDGKRLWTSRFGQYTSLRLAPAPDKTLHETAEAFRSSLHRYIDPQFAGLIFAPVKQLGLQASQGASDFGMLFLGFSFFIIIAAMLLVRLMFVLGVEQRTREVGVLVAVGFSPKQVRNLFVAEGGALALFGGGLGVLGGVGFAALMLHGLRTWWNASVGTTFLYLHIEPLTLLLGCALGVGVGLLSVFLAIRRLSREEPLELVTGGSLGGGSKINPKDEARAAKREEYIAAGGVALAVACLAGSGAATAGVQAGLFYGAGVGLLIACLSFLSARLRAGTVRTALIGGAFPVIRLGVRNAARNRGRSLLTIGLMSSATFVIVTVSAMRKEGGHDHPVRDSGDGGFALIAQCDTPILKDLNEPEDRFELGLQSETRELLKETEVYGFRLNPGEEASCLNLYRPSQPRILGAPQRFIERGGFAFQGAMNDLGSGDPENPWSLLNADLHDGAIPAIGDYNTVLWILHSGLGKTLEVRDGNDQPVPLRFVALLKGSALQGEVLIAEENFIDLYPERAGKEFFFIETPEQKTEEVSAFLERDLKPYGFDVTTTAARIESYHAVENTYLSTFQALGGLGLLLGTLGLTAVVLRGIIERRGELALMACVGYSNRALSLLVLAENFLLLFSGLGIGFGTALVASAPTLIQSGSMPQLGSLLLTLAAVLGTGMISGLGGVRALSRLPVLESLRAP